MVNGGKTSLNSNVLLFQVNSYTKIEVNNGRDYIYQRRQTSDIDDCSNDGCGFNKEGICEASGTECYGYIKVGMNMTDQELKNIDNLVIELRKMAQAIYLACDTEIAADVSLKTNKACRLINKLAQENVNLKHDLELISK
tara:strand:- start:51 stop:470 length:420 start_codon:yes stop_codon:yes gene_type:complete